MNSERIERNLGNLTKMPEQEKEIPLDYFVDNGVEYPGNRTVSFSPKFSNIGGQDILKYMLDHENPESQIKIKELTGFSIEELNKKRKSLERKYRIHKEEDKGGAKEE